MSKLKPEQNKQLGEVIDLFKHVNDATVLMFANKTQRKSAWELHKKYGDKVKFFVDFIPTYNARVKEFYHIKDPHSLLKNISNFFDVKRKYDADIKYQQEQKAKEEADRIEAEKLKQIPVSEKKQKFNSIMEIIKNA